MTDPGMTKKERLQEDGHGCLECDVDQIVENRFEYVVDWLTAASFYGDGDLFDILQGWHPFEDYRYARTDDTPEWTNADMARAFRAAADKLDGKETAIDWSDPNALYVLDGLRRSSNAMRDAIEAMQYTRDEISALLDEVGDE